MSDPAAEPASKQAGQRVRELAPASEHARPRASEREATGEQASDPAAEPASKQAGQRVRELAPASERASERATSRKSKQPRERANTGARKSKFSLEESRNTGARKILEALLCFFAAATRRITVSRHDPYLEL